MIIVGICENEQTSKTIQILREIIGSTKIRNSMIESYDFHSSTPPRMALKSYIDELRKNDIEIAVIKIIPERIAEGVYDNIKFNVLIYNNFKNDTGDRYNDEKVIIYKKLFESMEKQNIAIVNNDDNTVLELLKGTRMCVITYGLNSKATITASSIEQDVQDISLNYCIQRIITTLNKFAIEPQEFPIRIFSSVDKDIYALLAAVTTAIICGVSIKSIRQMTIL
ncbi:Mur ligase family protein [Petroclostridium sp. X23]|uniref:Mur ligase family protein n=1 Tax=Petroclostridium sp. X23 TaxID=3045146 RepID=UPI0024AE2367|nr:Mur ligase family protein [Petroclostridium sp. X23]WHH59017.1 Mur ligase family protein [Petroclostridium sp. X23]